MAIATIAQLSEISYTADIHPFYKKADVRFCSLNAPA